MSDDNFAYEWSLTLLDSEGTESKPYMIADLPLGVLNDIAKATDASWLMVMTQPLSNLDVAQALVHAVAHELGVTAPANLTGRNIVDLFKFVPGELPDAGTDPMDPKEPSEPDPLASAES